MAFSIPTAAAMLSLFVDHSPANSNDPEKQDRAGQPNEQASANINGEDLDEHDSGGNSEEESPEEHAQDMDGYEPAHRVSTSTSLASSFQRYSLPSWLLKIKDILFGSHPHDDVFIPNYRTLPIVSGSLIPFSILLEIPGLTEHWYVRTENNQIVEIKSNSALLDVAMALSMACALIANAALVVRFLERRVKAMTITSAVFLTVHDLINVVTVLVFGIEHRANDGFTYGQAYWLTVCSTIVSTITNVTLLWDFFTTPNFSRSGSGLTRKQRSLILITIIFLSYVALGALLTSLLMDLSFINGLFFTIVTTLTVGFGDIVPVTAVQRAVVCVYASFGIVILGAAIRLISEAVIEGLEIGYRRRVRQYKNQKRQKRKEAEHARKWQLAVEKRLQERNLDIWVQDAPPLQSEVGNTPSRLSVPSLDTRPFHFPVTGGAHLNTEGLSATELEAAAAEADVPLDRFVHQRIAKPLGRIRGDTHDSGLAPRDASPGSGSAHSAVPLNISSQSNAAEASSKTRARMSHWWTLKKVEKMKNKIEDSDSSKAFDAVKMLEKEEKRDLYTKLGLAWAVFLIFWTVGSAIFSLTENWTYGSAMYFCFIAFTTIGYGDFAPVTPAGRAIFIFWALLGVGAMTVLIAVISDAFSSKYRSVMHDRSFDKAIRRYRQERRKPSRDNRPPPVSASASGSQTLGRAIQANIGSLAAPPSTPPTTVTPRSQVTTLREAEQRLLDRFEAFPELIFEQVKMLREHMKYFLVTNGHATSEGMGALLDPQGIATLKDQEVPDEMKKLLNEIAQQEGMSERLKDEVWQDATARNTLFLLSIEKGVRKMIDAAETALVMMEQRDQLISATHERPPNPTLP